MKKSHYIFPSTNISTIQLQQLSKISLLLSKSLIETMQSPERWIYSLVYINLIFALIHFLDSILISNKLCVNYQDTKFKKVADLPLRFGSDGIFKILQVADMHYGNGMTTRCRDVLDAEFKYCSDLNSTRFLERMIQAERPDFVAFTGDNIFGTSTTDAAESLFEVFGPVIKSRIPWAAVLGNHDQESTMSRQELMYFISLMDYSLSQTRPSAAHSSEHSEDNPTPHVDGFGNYNLRVWGAPGSQLANSSVLNLYFLDSGDRAIVDGLRTYGWIKESQLHWLQNISKHSTGQNHANDQPTESNLVSTYPPALAFFHIPIPEIRKGPIWGLVGHYQEYVACSIVHSGVLQTFVSMGDVKAAFIGHDHNNDFCGKLDGIWFCYGGGFGYHGYGKAGQSRRARVIQVELGKGENSWMGVESIKTWKRLDDEMLNKIDEQVLWHSQTTR